jgi:hypothetical protein
MVMKFVHISFRFQYTEDIDKMLDNQGIVDYARYSMAEGKDIDGKHFGSKVFPGNFTVIQAIVSDDKVGSLLKEIEAFRTAKPARHHLRAVVLPVEGSVGFE